MVRRPMIAAVKLAAQHESEGEFEQRYTSLLDELEVRLDGVEVSSVFVASSEKTTYEATAQSRLRR